MKTLKISVRQIINEAGHIPLEQLELRERTFLLHVEREVVDVSKLVPRCGRAGSELLPVQHLLHQHARRIGVGQSGCALSGKLVSLSLKPIVFSLQLLSSSFCQLLLRLSEFGSGHCL